ncbi:MAG: aminoacyltransferase [Bacilli bacterium]|nr:aminoacyltransferase [Bacilli bacterium]
MEFVELTEDEFRTYSLTSPFKTFIQTPEMAKIREKNGYHSYYVGIKKEGRILAATMIGAKKGHFGYYEFYAPRGLLVDYENYELLSFFSKQLKYFIRKRKGYVLRIDPYYITEQKDIDGNTVEGGITHKKGIENLKKVGFIHSNEVYQQFTYMFSLSLNSTLEEIFKKFHTLPKRMIKKAEKNGVIIREASFEELKVVESLIQETSKREGFVARNLSYYEQLYEHFYSRNEVKFMLGEIILSEYKAKIELRIQELKKKSEDQEAKRQLAKELALLEEAEHMIPDSNGKVIISAGVFLLYGNELIYLFGGNKKEYLHLGSSYLMQWTMIQYGVQEHFEKYNFYGIMGKPSKEDGVYQFKRGFGGYVEELIGDYELPVHWYFYVQKLLHSLMHHS